MKHEQSEVDALAIVLANAKRYAQPEEVYPKQARAALDYFAAKAKPSPVSGPAAGALAEKAAIAAFEARQFDVVSSWNDATDKLKEFYRIEQRAALTAIGLIAAPAKETAGQIIASAYGKWRAEWGGGEINVREFGCIRDLVDDAVGPLIAIAETVPTKDAALRAAIARAKGEKS